MKNLSTKKFSGFQATYKPMWSLHLLLFTKNYQKEKNKESDYIKVKFQRNLTYEILEKYAYKMELFENGELEEFLIFIRDFK